MELRKGTEDLDGLPCTTSVGGAEALEHLWLVKSVSASSKAVKTNGKIAWLGWRGELRELLSRCHGFISI